MEKKESKAAEKKPAAKKQDKKELVVSTKKVTVVALKNHKTGLKKGNEYVVSENVAETLIDRELVKAK